MGQVIQGLEDRNVVFITLDSCRYDVALDATIPNLSGISPVIRGEAAGTYTLPAHIAYFNGFLPVPSGKRVTLGDTEADIIWRSAAARPTPARVAVPFTGRTIMEHYRRSGFGVLGAGGVTFFDAANPHNLLPSLFPEFRYYGRATRSRTGQRPRFGPQDRDTSLALSHARELAAFCLRAGRYFMFVNCASTHVPYTTPAYPLTSGLERLLERLYLLHELKVPSLDVRGLTPGERDELIGMQTRALEWADHQLGLLFAALRDTHPLVVVCADHGEEFGEGGRYGHAHSHETVTTVPLWCGLLN